MQMFDMNVICPNDSGIGMVNQWDMHKSFHKRGGFIIGYLFSSAGQGYQRELTTCRIVFRCSATGAARTIFEMHAPLPFKRAFKQLSDDIVLVEKPTIYTSRYCRRYRDIF